jgi:hypothetical protein
MNSRLLFSIFSMLLFLVMASSQVFAFVRDMGVKNAETSLIVRSMVVGLFTYGLYTTLN